VSGFFITLEGPEGSGKSSQARALAQALKRARRRVVFVRDPGSTALGRRLRRMLLHGRRAISPSTEAMLFIAGRIQLVEELIRPALREGTIVVCDRFHDSTVAYQGFGGGLPVPWLDRLGRQAIGNRMPDLTILLDVPSRVGLKRLAHAKDRMERKQLAFHQRVRNGFRALARWEPRRFVVVDAAQPKARIAQQIQTIVATRLKKGDYPMTASRLPQETRGGVVATVGVPGVDNALAKFPEALRGMGVTLEQHDGYKCSKVTTRRNWMQWNDGTRPLRIRFCNDQGKMRTWKLFARFGNEPQPSSPWEKPKEYTRQKAQWMPSGSDVWGCSYQALQVYLNESPKQLVKLLKKDLVRSHKYSSKQYG